MAIELEEVRQSQEIFAALLQKREIREKTQRSLFDMYMNSETVQELVKSQCEAVGCTCICYVDVIYLIPNEDNRWLGYSKTELKQQLCRSNPTEIDYYLVQFTILCLLLEFYDERGSEHKMREFIRTGDLLNIIAERLGEGRAKYSEEEQDAYGLAFTQMSQRYESMKAGSTNSRSGRATKSGFLNTILSFLEKQGLVSLSDNGEFIRTTQKLDHFMDWNLLNTDNFHRVLAVLKGTENEQDTDGEADQHQLQ